MSQDLEKETTASTAWSIIGAFAGLGMGFLFLCLIMGAVAYRNAPVLRETPDPNQKMINTLDEDFVALTSGGAVVADEGTKLRLFVKAHNVGNPVKVIYMVNSGAKGVMLSREAYLGKEPERREVMLLDKARFTQGEGTVGLEWTEEGAERSRIWATDRWRPKPKPPAKPAPKPKGKK